MGTQPFIISFDTECDRERAGIKTWPVCVIRVTFIMSQHRTVAFSFLWSNSGLSSKWRGPFFHLRLSTWLTQPHLPRRKEHKCARWASLLHTGAEAERLLLQLAAGLFDTPCLLPSWRRSATPSVSVWLEWCTRRRAKWAQMEFFFLWCLIRDECFSTVS